MEIDTKRRKLTLLELSDFIQSSQYVLENTLQTLGWDESKLNKIQYQLCPFNSHHQVPEKCMKKHITTCKLRHEGYSNDVEFLSDPGDTTQSYVVLDEEKRSSVIHNAIRKAPDMRKSCDPVCTSHPVPRTSDSVFACATPDERLALYDYVVEKTKHRHKHDLPLELPFPDIDSKDAEPKSALEVMAKERDAKRRSVSYKRVHTGRKSHTEVLREVIQSQMEMLETHATPKK